MTPAEPATFAVAARDALSASQRRVWEAVAAHVLAAGVPPTLVALCGAAGLPSTSHAYYFVRALIAKGFLDENWTVPGLAEAVRPAAVAHLARFRGAATGSAVPS